MLSFFVTIVCVLSIAVWLGLAWMIGRHAAVAFEQKRTSHGFIGMALLVGNVTLPLVLLTLWLTR